MKLSKKLVVILSCSLLAASCGNNSESKNTDTKEPASQPAAGSASTGAASDKGLELIGASDCTTCHRLDKNGNGSTIGPAYSEVAAKYSPAADSTVDRLVKKIISGGSGVWGTTPMTPHPAVKQEDVKEMVKYILSLKK